MVNSMPSNEQSFAYMAMNPSIGPSNKIKADPSTQSAVSWVSRCLTLEAENKKADEVWIEGLEKHRHSSFYLEHLALYFFRTEKYHKALEFCKKATDICDSLYARKTAIAAAFVMGQYHLVWDNFLHISVGEREKLESDLLSKCARAAMELSKFTEAQKLLQLLGHRSGLTPLPDLKTSLLHEFQNEKKLQSFMHETAQSFQKATVPTEVSLRNCILYASSLMHYDRYDEADNLLVRYRDAFIQRHSF